MSAHQDIRYRIHMICRSGWSLDDAAAACDGQFATCTSRMSLCSITYRDRNFLEAFSFRYLLPDDAPLDCRAGGGGGEVFPTARLHAAIRQWVDADTVPLWRDCGCGLRVALGLQQPLDRDPAFVTYIKRFFVGLREYKDLALFLELDMQGQYI
jgi:hypothetical protein